MIYLFILIIDKLIKFLLFESPLIYIKNTGLIFGLEFDSVFIIFITLLLFSILYVLVKRVKFLELEIKLIILGCIMNLSDRIIWGGVIDYINILNILVINLADVIIMLGIIKILIKTYLSEKNKVINK